MKHLILVFALLATGVYVQTATAQAEESVQHVEVYREDGMYGGWPANFGVWRWGEEILVGFAKGYYKDLGTRHHIDRDSTEWHLLARSLDGGATWSIEDPGTSGALVMPCEEGCMGEPRKDVAAREPRECNEGINFTYPDFTLAAKMSNVDAGRSRYWYSYDRGHSWNGPCRIPNFGAPGTAARTDYIVEGPETLTMFITAAKSNAEEGRPMAIRTTDGGKTWRFLSWIGPEPSGFSIMPASVRLSDSDLVVAVRRREGERRFIAAFRSGDNGRTWAPLPNPVGDTGVGNPPAMIRLADGRLLLVYGHRAEPYEIRARLSSDSGYTWSRDYVLRAGGSGRDIGYPRVVQRPDGKIVAIYYFEDGVKGPERFIEAAIWAPPPPDQEAHE
jgi:hypothetical protein